MEIILHQLIQTVPPDLILALQKQRKMKVMPLIEGVEGEEEAQVEGLQQEVNLQAVEIQVHNVMMHLNNLLQYK